MEPNLELTWPFQLRQLAVMIDAGIPIDTALKSLDKNQGNSSSKIRKATGLVTRGYSLPDSFRRADVIGDFDCAMLLAADSAGSLADGLNHISERRVNQLQRVESLKASLILPKAIVIIGGLAGVFTRTAAGYQSVAEACLSVAIIAVWFYLIAYASLLVIRADTRIWMSWFWPYPTIRKSSQWYCLALEYFFYNSFIWQIAGGVSASAAAKGCSHLLSSTHFQRSVLSASDAMGQGTSMAKALVGEELVLTSRLRQVLLIADESGTHEAAIKNELALRRHDLKQKADNFFKWVPRVFYLIALVLASKMIVT